MRHRHSTLSPWLTLLVGLSLAAPALAQEGALPPAAAPAPPNPALRDPSLARETAPAVYRVRLKTTQGDIVLEVKREWSPNAADRLYNMVRIGFLDGAAFFRNISGFMVQFGLSPDANVNMAWRLARMKDDPVRLSNSAGTITFAMSGKDTRTTQMFINHTDNKQLDDMGFSPFGAVVEGKDVLAKLYTGYGEGAPNGRGPDQQRIMVEGDKYLQKSFPKLDKIVKATIEP